MREREEMRKKMGRGRDKDGQKKEAEKLWWQEAKRVYGCTFYYETCLSNFFPLHALSPVMTLQLFTFFT